MGTPTFLYLLSLWPGLDCGELALCTRLGLHRAGCSVPHHQMWCSWQRPRPVSLSILGTFTPVTVCPSARSHLGCWHECSHSAQPPRKHTDAGQLGQRSDSGDLLVKVTVLWAFSCFTVSNGWRGETKPELPTRKDPNPHPLCAPSQGCHGVPGALLQ